MQSKLLIITSFKAFKNIFQTSFFKLEADAKQESNIKKQPKLRKLPLRTSQHLRLQLPLFYKKFKQH